MPAIVVLFAGSTRSCKSEYVHRHTNVNKKTIAAMGRSYRELHHVG
jgi:hypothetical protein